jgi:CTP:molybdopterin cytidylyltransferase MocA
VSPASESFAAIILAADRGAEDPVATAARVPGKCLAPLGGKPMVLRVLDALAALPEIDPCVLSGPDWSIVTRSAPLHERIQTGSVRWLGHEDSPSRSAAAALRLLPSERPVLLTTADHPLLTPAMLRHFLAELKTLSCDAALAVAPYRKVAEAFPESRRTVTRFRDGGYCGCNLFAFLTPRGRDAAIFWQRVEAQRKRPLRVMGTLGWRTVIRYALGRLTLAQAVDRLSELTRLRIGVVSMPFPEAAVDVDTEADLALAQRILSARQESPA